MYKLNIIYILKYIYHEVDLRVVLLLEVSLDLDRFLSLLYGELFGILLSLDLERLTDFTSLSGVMDLL